MDNGLASMGEYPGNIFKKAAARYMGDSVDTEIAEKVEDGFYIDAGRSQHRFAQRSAEAGDDSVDLKPHHIEKDFTGKRVTVAVKTAGSDADQFVADGD